MAAKRKKTDNTMKAAKSFSLNIKPVFLISSLGGICGLDVTDKLLTPSILGSSLTSIMIFINFVHLIMLPYGIYFVETRSAILDEGKETLSSQHFITKLINPVLVSSVALLSRLIAIWKIHRKLPKIFNLLLEIDTSLSPTKTFFNHEFILIRVLLIVLMLCSIPFQIYSALRISSSFFHALIFLPNVYNNFSTTCCELQFIILAVLIARRFHLLHQKLKDIDCGNFNIFPIDFPKLLISNPQLGETKLIGNVNGDVLKDLRVLRQSHGKLIEASANLNDVFSAHLFISLLSLGVNTLLNLYFAIFGGFRGPATMKIIIQPTSSILNSIGWSFYYFSRYSLICYATELITSKANSTKNFVSKLLRPSLPVNCKEELWTFLGYCVSRKIKFTALGFFRIDCTLITTAVATGSTYLVILAQFHRG